MRKMLVYLFLIASIFSFHMDVEAQVYEKLELIGIGDNATVETDIFTYRDFNIEVKADGKKAVKFSGITNNSTKKMPVSINLLLFDSNKTNIGYLTYCTEKDLSSNYTDFQLSPNATSAFSINVTEKYLIEGKNINDIQYFSVMDENKYCHVGGYGKYQGLTLEQIRDGKVAANVGEKNYSFDFIAFLKNKSLITLLSIGMAILLSLMIIGSVLNALYKRMFVTTSVMSYLPLLSNFVAVRLAFGNLISKIYLVILLIATGLLFINFNLIFIIVNIVAVVAFMVDIVKLITKKYELFYFAPEARNTISDSNNLNVVTSDDFTNNISSQVKKEETLEDDIIDLSYNNPISGGDSNLSSNNDISAGKGPLSEKDAFGGMFSNTLENGKQPSDDNNSTGESDLTKFFK